MKKKKVNFNHLILLFFLFNILIGCKSKEPEKEEEQLQTLVIHGKINEVLDGTISLEEIESDEEEGGIIEDTRIVNGRFLFENLNISEKRAAYLKYGDSLKTVVFLEPGTLKVEVILNDTIYSEISPGIELGALLQGTANNEAFGQYRLQRKEINDTPRYQILKKYDQIVYSDNPDFNVANEIIKGKVGLHAQRDSLILALKQNTVQEHKDKIMSAYLLVHEDYGLGDNMETGKMVSFIDMLDVQLIGNQYYDRLAAFAQASRNTIVGATAPDFTLTNEKGETVTLSSLKKEYVLVDFWAYWCVPCIASFPHLEKIREKYGAKGFEILGVSQDPNKEKWLGALYKYHPSWIQVIDNQNNVVSESYNILELPTTFLLDKNRVIIGKNLNEEELEEKLAEMLLTE